MGKVTITSGGDSLFPFANWGRVCQSWWTRADHTIYSEGVTVGMCEHLGQFPCCWQQFDVAVALEARTFARIPRIDEGAGGE
jgi:hypothetical protein